MASIASTLIDVSKGIAVFKLIFCVAPLVAASLSHAVCPFNGSGALIATASNDALLLLRATQGERDATLIEGTASAQLANSVVSDIVAHVRTLDVDASGVFDETDAIIAARYMFGFRAEALTAALGSVGALRDTGAKVEAYIVGGCNAQKNVRFPIDPGVIDVTKPPYNADNTGVADASDAIRLAIRDYLGTRAFIYLPNGTYRITKPLYWKDDPFPGNPESWWGRLVFRGQSREGTILKLDDNIALFSDPNMPTGVIVTASENPFLNGGNNQGFQNSIRDLTINTGSGNPGDPSEWANVTDYGAVPDFNVDSTTGIQAALNAGKSVVWFPGPGKFYRITDTLTVPPGVRMIQGVNPIIQASDPNFANGNALRGFFKLTGSSSDPPLIFEHIEVGANSGDGAVGLDHSSTRTVVWKHGILGGGWGNRMTPNYINSVTGGKLFIEDVIGSKYRITGPQKVWARQLNTEYGVAPTVSISGVGASLWILGRKVENSPEQPILRVADGARVEALGLHAYMLDSSGTTPFIENINGHVSISYRQAGQAAYRVAVRETRDGETREEYDVYGLITLYDAYR
jgi:Pectate lyase superfamily protein